MSQTAEEKKFSQAEVDQAVKVAEAKARREQQALADSELGGIKQELRALKIEKESDMRENADSADNFAAMDKYATKSGHTAIRIMLFFHREFKTVDAFAEEFAKPKSNALLIIAVVTVVGLGLYFSNPANSEAFFKWYNAGYDWLGFWGLVGAFAFGVRWYLRRQTREVQISV